jgi:spermidine/putrescine transport system substrate-binding protein
VVHLGSNPAAAVKESASMFWLVRILAALSLSIWASAAYAGGELNIYNWANYTNPELIKKFEETYKIKVTLTDYDSNDTALAKIRAGGHGFDIVVPSANYVPIWIAEGLLLETRPDRMENFKNVEPKWADVPFDPGRRYTVPWQWGTVGLLVNTKYFKGDINTSKLIFDPPDEIKGKITLVPEMGDMMATAIMYAGGEPCSGDKMLLKKVRDMLLAAKKHWLSISYGSTDSAVQEDYWVGLEWNGGVFRARLKNPAIKFGYPREGYAIWMDNVAVLKDAKNIENAKLFQNFVMAPENAALISSFARFANAIKGSETFMPDDMKNAPEIVIPKEFEAMGKFIPACPPEVNDLYTKIWTEVLN